LLNPLLAWVSGIAIICLKTSKQQAIGSNPIRFTNKYSKPFNEVGRLFHLEARQIYLPERTKEKSVYPRSGWTAALRIWVRTSQEYLDHRGEAEIIQSGSQRRHNEDVSAFLLEGDASLLAGA